MTEPVDEIGVEGHNAGSRSTTVGSRIAPGKDLDRNYPGIFGHTAEAGVCSGGNPRHVSPMITSGERSAAVQTGATPQHGGLAVGTERGDGVGGVDGGITGFVHDLAGEERMPLVDPRIQNGDGLA